MSGKAADRLNIASDGMPRTPNNHVDIKKTTLAAGVVIMM
jgi:hypothetical protein